MHDERQDRPQRPGRKGRASVWKTLLYMVIMGVICVWVAIQGYGLEIRMGMSPTGAAKLPNYAFFAGLGLGVLIGISPNVREIFGALAAMVVMGGVLWFIGVIIGGLMVGFGLSSDKASLIPPVTLGIGLLLGSVVVYAVGQDMVKALFHRLKAGRSNNA
jgi:hypothetical protein